MGESTYKIYRTWTETALYCDDSGQDCINCPIMQIKHTASLPLAIEPGNSLSMNRCMMPKAIEILRERGIPKPLRVEPMSYKRDYAPKDYGLTLGKARSVTGFYPFDCGLHVSRGISS